jgi:glycosyltransferase involved in cell wall biosynthesis
MITAETIPPCRDNCPAHPKGGHCARHGIYKPAQWVRLCRAGGSYWRAWEAGKGPAQTKVPNRSRGLGDSIAKLTSAVGIKPCGGCHARQEWLNRWVPFRKAYPAADDRIRVGLLTPVLSFGGAERWVASLAVGLDPARIDVVGVAVRDRSAIFPAIGDTIRRQQPGRPGCEIREGADSFVWLADRCEVLIAWGLPDLSMLAGYSDQGGRVVMVSHGHCAWTVQALRTAMPCVTDCAAVSRHAVLSFQEAGVPAARVTVVHNGIDTDRCALAVGTREETRAEWGLQPGEIAVGYLGRLDDTQKNISATVKAVQALGPPFRMVIVGGGPGAERHVANWRRILPNLVYRPPVNEVGDIYRALDCFALAPRFEGFSLALTEAWYCGCPTVVTPVGATEVEEEHGQLSVRIPIGCTAEEMAAGIRVAIAPENLPVVFRASRVVAEHYTAAAMCRRWEAYLERIGNDARTY